MVSAGDRLGPYTLERHSRTRGSAEIWIASSADAPKTGLVSVSISPLGHKNEREALRVFTENIKIAQLVRHPNMAEVLGGGHHEDLRWIASDTGEFIDLVRLFEVARTNNFWIAPGTAGFIALQIARALAYIHALTTPEGLPLYLVHRDVAPHSVLIDRTGTVKLSEFVGAIETQALIKTAGQDSSDHVAYLSPELASYGRADARSDVFALGTVLWELLTRKPLFLRDNDLQTLEAVRTAEIPSVPPEVPPELATAAQAALRKAPHERPMSLALAEMLDAAISALECADAQSVAALYQKVIETDGHAPRPRVRTARLSSNVPASALPRSSGGPKSAPERDPFFDASRDGLFWEGQRFTALGKLGSGGMGEVYRVRDHELDEVVALKLIPRESTTEMRSTERLKREVRLARKIASPYVCRIYDIVDLGRGTRGLTMALVEGTTLAEMMRNGVPVDYKRFARWGADVAEGLAAAHEHNVIHRDLKPENVMIRGDNRAVILDFGIAFGDESYDQSIKLTQQGMIMGTPLYMSPEQLLNLPLDARSDLFALGLMLAELVTGEVPMRGASYPELVEKRVTQAVEFHLNDVDPAAPRVLAEVVDALLKITAADRPAEARGVSLRLREIAEESGAIRVGSLAPISSPRATPLPEVTEPKAELPVPSAIPEAPPPSAIPQPIQAVAQSSKLTAIALSLAAVVIIGLSVLLAKPRNDDPEDETAGVITTAIFPDAGPDTPATPDAGIVAEETSADAGTATEVAPAKKDGGQKKNVIPPAEEM